MIDGRRCSGEDVTRHLVFHHQPEAQHPKSSAIHKLGRPITPSSGPTEAFGPRRRSTAEGLIEDFSEWFLRIEFSRQPMHRLSSLHKTVKADLEKTQGVKLCDRLGFVVPP